MKEVLDSKPKNWGPLPWGLPDIARGRCYRGRKALYGMVRHTTALTPSKCHRKPCA